MSPRACYARRMLERMIEIVALEYDFAAEAGTACTLCAASSAASRSPP
ncbi:MAG: hypothetical protein IPF50_18585 [Proteobacteria bacterium]|nr:hypothetical protein [Pseudomonadota bacterium]